MAKGMISKNMEDVDEIIVHINYCLLPKLSRNYDDIDNHPECYDRLNKMKKHFPPILHLLADMDFNSSVDKLSSRALPSIIILYLDCVNHTSVWNINPQIINYGHMLNQAFLKKSGISLEYILQSSSHFNVQEVFDNIMLELNSKLTAYEFKKYPCLLDVYYKLMRNIKDYNIKINPVKIFPISFLLIDDLQNSNKINGLNFCISIMQCLNEKYFKSGNYYEVLFGSFKKAMHVKDIQVTRLVFQCLLELIEIVPSDVKKKKTDEVFGCILEQLHLESNLHRKNVCVKFLKKVILVHKVNCVNRKLLETVLLECIHICCYDAVADILLDDVLECLQVWISHCWCVWRLSADRRILSALIKLLYVSRKESVATIIKDQILALITLCTKEEQKYIYSNLEKSEIKSPEFNEKLEEIKLYVFKLISKPS